MYCTVAAIVMAIYRENYLPKDTIGIVPKYVYGSATKPYSKSSLEWLDKFSYFTWKEWWREKTLDEELGKLYYFAKKQNF